MRKKNSFGVKFITSILFIIAALVVAVIITPPIFSLFAPMITALPFETPTNFMVADYVGMTFMALEAFIIFVYTKKWAWR